MKIKIDVDCTPEEARNFLGLPDLAPMQQALAKDLEARLRSALAQADPEKLWQDWMPAGAQGLERWQEFWSQMLTAACGKETKT